MIKQLQFEDFNLDGSMGWKYHQMIKPYIEVGGERVYIFLIYKTNGYFWIQEKFFLNSDLADKKLFRTPIADKEEVKRAAQELFEQYVGLLIT